MSTRLHRSLPVFLALLCVGTAYAGEDGRHRPSGGDHEIARSAVARGELLPLSKILQIAQRDYPGKMLEVELERDDGRYVYEIEILLADGRVIELTYDGKTGELLETEIDD
jgi:uncharacterized membrane protein YkoI